ncbi:MAG: hypothetical protein KJ977_00780, partial [Candidatus Omnitrophica bacterium]|nr:hypothetical protein [Candidatus Omnitrophota bacterium]
MIFYCLGIDHRKTDLATREQAYFKKRQILEFWRQPARKAEVLFTCNRIEIYGFSQSRSALEEAVSAFKRELAPLFKQAYLKLGTDEVTGHALRLACGLESQILAEKQIFLQLQSWLGEETFLWPLKQLWLEVLAKTKGLRQSLALEGLSSSLSDIVLEDLILNTGWGLRKKVLIVGTGKV